jgi:hypothetical protein
MAEAKKRQMIGTPVVIGTGRSAEAAVFRAFFLLAFPVDTASEFLPKRFGRQG